MVVIGVLYIDVVGAAGSWRWLSVSCIALCVIWDGIFDLSASVIDNELLLHNFMSFAFLLKSDSTLTFKPSGIPTLTT